LVLPDVTQILRLKCTKFAFRWAQTQIPLLQRSPDFLAVFNGLLLRGGRKREWEGKESKGHRRRREGFGPPKNFGVAPPTGVLFTYRSRQDKIHFWASCFLSDTVRLLASPDVPNTNTYTPDVTDQ